MGNRARWRKVWADLWSTPSLLHLTYQALYLFVVAVVHASWEPGQDEGQLTVGEGKPMPRAVLARLARMPASAVGKSLKALEEAGAVRLDGALVVIPNFGRWQETADAARKRRVRGHSTGQGGGHSGESPSPSPSPSPSASPSGREAKPNLPTALCEDDRDDPAVRSVGQLRSPPKFDLHTVEHWRLEWIASLPDGQREDAPAFSRGPRHGEGVDLVASDPSVSAKRAREVVEFGLEAARHDERMRKLLATMFHGGTGGGFGAWVERLREHEATEKRRAEAEAAAAQEKREAEERLQEAERLDPDKVLREMNSPWAS